METQIPERSKVPQVTLFFWIIKILCTTVGETASDFLNVNLGMGLVWTSVVMGGALLVALIVQFRTKKYHPVVYWVSVVLISVFGTLVTDIMTDSIGVPLELSTLVFTLLLALTFLFWYLKEKTLSIHSITTWQRETFYWLAILFTFALGTASGDLMAEGLGLGYLVTGLIVAAVILLVTIGWKLGLHSVLAFWIAYIMTRPLGASLGDYLSQPAANGGLGFGTSITTAFFTLGILLIVSYFVVTKRDAHAPKDRHPEYGGLWQTIVVVGILLIAGVSGYVLRSSALQQQAVATVSATKPLGDLSAFKHITSDTLALVRAGQLREAKTRVADLETAWDDAQAHLKAMDKNRWTEVDDAIDEVLSQLRARNPDAQMCEESLVALQDILNRLDP
ncbi:MAG TPA: hypothetical protein VLJ21_00540 [Candidatus Binatia bacterium]|nr:hypothetical protein [Candidatus Binatia bacterium]